MCMGRQRFLVANVVFTKAGLGWQAQKHAVLGRDDLKMELARPELPKLESQWSSAKTASASQRRWDELKKNAHYKRKGPPNPLRADWGAPGQEKEGGTLTERGGWSTSTGRALIAKTSAAFRRRTGNPHSDSISFSLDSSAGASDSDSCSTKRLPVRPGCTPSAVAVTRQASNPR